MAKTKGRPKTSNRNDVAVKLDRSLAFKARQIVEHEGIVGGIAALLDEIVAGPLSRRYAKMLREVDERGKVG